MSSLQLTVSEISLEEMKKTALEIKLLRPIQEAFVAFFKAETLEEIKHEFGSEVWSEKLLRFLVSCGDSIWCAHALRSFIIQLHFVEYKKRPKRVQISRSICTPEDRLDRLSHNVQATNWIEVTKKNFVCQNEFLFYVFS